VSSLPPQIPTPQLEEPPAPADLSGDKKAESGTGRKFPCPGCGAKLDFNPSQRELKCPYCGYSEAIDPASEAVRERDWDEYWQNAESHTETIAGRSSEVACKACAAVVLLDDKVATDRCPYCGNDLDNKPVAAQGMILPEGLLPFKIDEKHAIAAFNHWISGRWFAPRDLKQLMNRGKFSGVYVPFWTFDSMTYTHYTGQRGDNYQETETYTEPETYTTTDGQGNQTTQTRMVTKTRTVTKIRWTAVSGNVDHFFDDVLVCASHSIPDNLIQQLTPWDLPNVETFRPEFLAGFQTERYTIGLQEGFAAARGIMDGEIRTLCCRDIGGDHQQLNTVNTQHTAITFKHILQPVWLAPYRYREKLFRIVVNARTGEVVGTRPYSFWKITLFILVIIAAIAAAVGIAALVHSTHGAGAGSPAPRPPAAEAEIGDASDTPIAPQLGDPHSIIHHPRPSILDPPSSLPDRRKLRPRSLLPWHHA
jgi:DNA-directed RNA polymerase subunit RPC12/RpoP